MSKAQAVAGWVEGHRYSLATTIGGVLLIVAVVITVFRSEPPALVIGGVALVVYGLARESLRSAKVGPGGLEIEMGRLAKAAEEAADSATDEQLALFGRMMASALRAVVDTAPPDAQATTRPVAPEVAAVEKAAPLIRDLAASAVDWVMDLERRAGRDPRAADPRGRDVGYDILSSPRRIDVKAFAAAAPVVRMHQLPSADGPTHVYVVENVAAETPEAFRLRVVPVADLANARLIYGNRETRRTPHFAMSLRGYPSLTAEEALSGPLKDLVDGDA